LQTVKSAVGHDGAEMETKLLGTSRVSSAKIRNEDLGTPGARIQLHIVPKFEGDQASNVDVLKDASERSFRVSARLSHAPSIVGEIKAGFDEKDGSSFLILPPNAAELRVDSSYGTFWIKSNKARQLSLVELHCRANSPGQAEIKFMNAVHPALDHFSYLYNVPLFVSMIRVNDVTHQSIHVACSAPYGSQVVTQNALHQLFLDMKPVYAMYREAKNSESYFYKFLCCYKIMEGLIGGMRASAYARAKKAGIEIKSERILVPNDEHLAPEIRQYVGKSINHLFDEFLTERFRNAIAHFTTEKGALDISSPVALEMYAGVALVADLCARELIRGHEKLLAQLPRN
jgi:hypothetical protein